MALVLAALAFAGCTVRERTIYEDCVRARCSPGEGSCKNVGTDADAGLSGVSVCTRECSVDEDCPEDARTELPGRCVALPDGDYCLPTCGDGFDCSVPLVCDEAAGVCMPEEL